MLRLIGTVIAIGLADSLNPSTIAPALYLATERRGRIRVAEFTVAVFTVSLLGGIVISLGPGQLILSLLPHVGHRFGQVTEVVAGVAMLAAAPVLWRHRDRLSSRPLPEVSAERKSSAILGATITAVELPTAFPYFAAIAAIVGADLDPARQVGLLVLFNLCFVLPLLGILATLVVAGANAQRPLAVGRQFLQRHWPRLLAILALLAGAFVVLLGVTGLTGGRGRFGRLMRHVHHFLHP
ncbi:MAG: GAP family protein [Solirubrobacterales bacterium]|nr:GAP family protein [Solirubrobacterales bacterium]